MGDVKWIKVSVGMFDDEKIRQIRAMPDGNAILLIWLQILLLAGRSNEDGALILSGTEIPYTDAMLATEFGMPLNTVKLALEVFTTFRMLDIIDDVYQVSNWSKHQSIEGMEKIREQARDRKRKQREKLKALPSPEEPAEEPKPDRQKERFDTFWKAYPKKVGKGAAEKAFGKYKVSEALLTAMLEAIRKAKNSLQWKRDGGQYIPNPATWLNQRRWEDEVVEDRPEPQNREMENWN